MKKLRLDFETYSEADIKDVGAWAYSAHPSTRVLMLAWAFDDDTPVIWLPGTPLPDWATHLNPAQELGFIFSAWNDFFEFCIMKNTLKWTVPPPQYWSDTAAKAAVLALPRSLGECGEVLGLTGASAKNTDGKRLIQLFSKPKKSAKKGNKGELVRTLPEDAPEDFEKLKNYCIQDVIAERAIDKLLPELQPETRRLWELDRKINTLGVRFDMTGVNNALVVIAKAQGIITERVKKITGGKLSNITSWMQFLAYLAGIGTVLENSQKEYLIRALAKVENDSAKAHAAEIIRLRLAISKSSLAKYDKLAGIVDGDTSRAYGLLRFHGASTGRWSGNLFQPQNLPRASVDMPELCIDLLSLRDPEAIELLFGDCLEAIVCCLRGMITASPGNRLIVSDFSQIESRVLAWLVGATEKIQAYADDMDIYKLNAAAAFKVKYSDVTKAQRQIGKVIELACGYGGGVGAFKKFADVYGVVIPDDEAETLIKTWRMANPKITSYWYNIESTAIKAVQEPGAIHRIRNVSFRVQGAGACKFLFCYLPSGRRIAYHLPKLADTGYGKPQIEYMGVDSTTKKHKAQRTYGGKLVENITQAVAADCMIDAMHRVEAAGYPIILTVHDEIVSDTPKKQGSMEHFNRIMSAVPAWAQGLPIAAEGYESERYKK